MGGVASTTVTGVSASVGGVMGADLSGMVAATATITSTTAGILTTLDTAINGVQSQRATFGAMSNRLEHAVDNLTNVSQNSSASLSRIQDADYAAETTELARTQIIAQAATAMLSQANQQAQSVLALLK
jgi:flagellin